jgi:hypothetical protein
LTGKAPTLTGAVGEVTIFLGSWLNIQLATLKRPTPVSKITIGQLGSRKPYLQINTLTLFRNAFFFVVLRAPDDRNREAIGSLL